MSWKRWNPLPARSVPSSLWITSCGLLKSIKRVSMLSMINVIFYRMALAPFRMATSERYEHCIVHTVFEHYIMNFVLFNFVVWHDAYFIWILSYMRHNILLVEHWRGGLYFMCEYWSCMNETINDWSICRSFKLTGQKRTWLSKKNRLGKTRLVWLGRIRRNV